MEAPVSSRSARFVYDRRYVEPEIQLLAVERLGTSPEGVELIDRLRRYRPTGVRTTAGLYEYELISDSPLR